MRNLVGLNQIYRPKRFSDLCGQKLITAILQSGVRNNIIPQQILLSGGSGLGKTTIGRILASTLLCHQLVEINGILEPCLTCVSCNYVRDNSHPDLIEIDAASFGGKDEIKDISIKSSYSPIISKYKIYIIDEAHGITNAGGQAFLKTLEEPPNHVIFILCTTDPEKMLVTNRSRCVELKVCEPNFEEKAELVKNILVNENIKLEESEISDLINFSSSELGIRGLLTNLSKVINIKRSEELISVAETLEIPDSVRIISLINLYLEGNEREVLLELRELSKKYQIAQIKYQLINILIKKLDLNLCRKLLLNLLESDNSYNKLIYSFLKEMKLEKLSNEGGKDNISYVESKISKKVKKTDEKGMLSETKKELKNKREDFNDTEKKISSEENKIYRKKTNSEIVIEFKNSFENNFLLSKLIEKCSVRVDNETLEVRAEKEVGEKLIEFLPEIKSAITGMGYKYKFGKI